MNPGSDPWVERALTHYLWLRLIPSANRPDLAWYVVGYSPEEPEQQPSTLAELRQDVYRTLLGINARVIRQQGVRELNEYVDVGEIRKHQALRILHALAAPTTDDMTALALVSMDTRASSDTNRRAIAAVADLDWRSWLTLGECLLRSEEPDLREVGRSLPARLHDSDPAIVLIRELAQRGSAHETGSGKESAPVATSGLGCSLGVIIAWLIANAAVGLQQVGLRLSGEHASLIAPLLRELLDRGDPRTPS